MKRLEKWRSNRNSNDVKDALERVKEAMSNYNSIEKAGNLMPKLIEAAKAKCTLGEMMDSIVEVSGGRIYST